ncbi:MAG TPA: hypothetical protein VGE60_09420 [Telluria sp.]
MKQFWIRLSTRVDALSLRERMTGFAAVLALVVFAAYVLVLVPRFEKQEQLAALVERQQATIVQIAGQMDQLARTARADPDAAALARLTEVQTGIDQLGGELRAMQESLVSPQRVTPVLEQMLRSNGQLRLISLRTLPVTGLSEALPVPGPAGASPAQADVVAAPPVAGKTPAVPVVAKAPELVYRHGVEMTLEGRYLDMVNYLSSLESMPVQFIWGPAHLDASDYPRARLTVTLFTLSLEKEWMKL